MSGNITLIKSEMNARIEWKLSNLFESADASFFTSPKFAIFNCVCDLNIRFTYPGFVYMYLFKYTGSEINGECIMGIKKCGDRVTRNEKIKFSLVKGESRVGLQLKSVQDLRASHGLSPYHRLTVFCNVQLTEVISDPVVNILNPSLRGYMEGIPGPSKAPVESTVVIKRKRKLPKGAVKNLLSWLEDHQENAYPSEEVKLQLAKDNGITVQQVLHWFINARRRHLPRILKKGGKNPEDFRVTRKKFKSSELCNNSGTRDESDSFNGVHQRPVKIPTSSTVSNSELESKTAALRKRQKEIADEWKVLGGEGIIHYLILLLCIPDAVILEERAEDLKNNLDTSNTESNKVISDELSTHEIACQGKIRV